MGTFCGLLIFLSVSFLSFSNSLPTKTALSLPSFLAPSAIAMSDRQSQNAPSEIIDAVRQDLSRRTRIEGDRLTIVETSRQTWSDGCLGLAQPDEICTQALVDGWRVVLSYGDRSWIYRTDDRGMTVRLESE
jgi:hypothetical protein